MSLEALLKLIRQNYSPGDGQIIVRSLPRDPLVWHFIQNSDEFLSHIDSKLNDVDVFSPGEIASWVINKKKGENFFNPKAEVELDHLADQEKSGINTRIKAIFPPNNLFDAGLHAINLLNYRKQKNTWAGVSEEIFHHRNPHSVHLNYQIWRTPFACLVNWCEDFDSLSTELLQSDFAIIIKMFLPIFVHALLANPLSDDQLLEKFYRAFKPLSIDIQLEGLQWVDKYNHKNLLHNLANNLLELKTNRDFLANVFSELEEFEAVNPQIDPIDKHVRFNLPEDLNRLAAFYHVAGDYKKATETYQKSNDLFEFLKAQTQFQVLIGEQNRVPSSKWLDIIKSVPHSKRAVQYHIRSLIQDQQTEEAQKQINELPESLEKQYLNYRLHSKEQSELNSFVKKSLGSISENQGYLYKKPSYFVNHSNFIKSQDIQEIIAQNNHNPASINWADDYLKANFHDPKAIDFASQFYQSIGEVAKSITLATYLERLEPDKTERKQTLSQLLAHEKRWEEVFSYSHDLINSEENPQIEDLERFAEAALRTTKIEEALSAVLSILKRDAHNKKALILLGEIYFYKGDAPKAIQHMETVVKTIPEESQAWLILAWLWEESGQTNRKLEILRNGLNANPDQPELLRALGKTQMELKALPEALITLRQAYSLQPNDQEGKFYLADTYYQLGQAQNAYEILVDFLDNYQQDPRLAKLIGNVLIALGKKDLAEPIMLFAAENLPDDDTTKINAAQLVLDRIENASATDQDVLLEKIEELISGIENNDQAKRQKADIFRLRQDFEISFEIYTQLSKDGLGAKSPSDWRINYGMGMSAMGLKRHEIGLAALQMAMDDEPRNLLIHHSLAESFLAANLPGKAHIIADSTLKISPQDFHNLLWFANFKTRADKPGEAVRALKEALQIAPEQQELKLLLAKSLVAEGSLDNAQKTIESFIQADESGVTLLREAAHICVNLNNLPLAIKALEKALTKLQTSPILRMELSVLYSLLEQTKKAIDVLDVNQNQLEENPEIVILKSDMHISLGQHDQAYKILKSVEDSIYSIENKSESESIDSASSPLLYMHDFTIKGYQIRLGLLSRALGVFEESQNYLGIARSIDENDLELINFQTESALMNLEFTKALTILNDINLENIAENCSQNEAIDLLCTQAEIFLYQKEPERAKRAITHLDAEKTKNPRLLAVSCRLAIEEGKMNVAHDFLDKAFQQFLDNYNNISSKSLPAMFRHIRQLHSMAEAYLVVGDYKRAALSWDEISKLVTSQNLVNLRYLNALIEGAEKQRIAKAASIEIHRPGEEFLSERNKNFAEQLFNRVSNIFPQDQATILKARLISAFTGQWPIQINVDAFLQGPEEAAAMILGSKDHQMIEGILEKYPEELNVLQAYGVYAIQQKIKGGRELIEKAISIDSTNPVYYALHAKLCFDDTAQALESIIKALSFWPDESQWHFLAADLYRHIGDQESAQNHISSALEQQPQNADYWQLSGLLKADSDNLEAAKIDLENSVSIQSENSQTWVKMAEVNYRLGDINSAIENIQKANQLNPEDENPEDIELQLLFDQKNYQDLEQRAQKILSKNPQRETAIIALSQAFTMQGKFDQAYNLLQKSNEDFPSNPRLILERIKTKKQQYGITPVLPELIALAEEYPNHPNVLTELTDWLIQSNRLEEAEEAAQVILKIIPNQVNIYVMLGRLQRKKGKLDQAISHLSNAITLDSRLIEAYIELGKTYQDRRDLEKALETYQLASNANRYDPRPYYFASLALKENKDYQNSELMLKQAKALAPDDHNIIRQLGVVSALNLINNLREAM